MTKGGGHGDYRLIVFAPDSVQEAVDLTYSAFDTADKYRTPVVILGDGMIGQMMEPVEMPMRLPSFRKALGYDRLRQRRAPYYKQPLYRAGHYGKG